MLRALRSLGKEAIILNADPTPEKFAYLDADRIVGVLEKRGAAAPPTSRISLCSCWTRTTCTISARSRRSCSRGSRDHFIIDHHEQDRGHLHGQLHPEERLLHVGDHLPAPARDERERSTFPIAQALFTGIVYDTGCFIYPKTTALTFEIARDLVSLGVEPNFVYAKIYESNSISALVLQSRSSPPSSCATTTTCRS